MSPIFAFMKGMTEAKATTLNTQHNFDQETHKTPAQQHGGVAGSFLLQQPSPGTTHAHSHFSSQLQFTLLPPPPSSLRPSKINTQAPHLRKQEITRPPLTPLTHPPNLQPPPLLSSLVFPFLLSPPPSLPPSPLLQWNTTPPPPISLVMHPLFKTPFSLPRPLTPLSTNSIQTRFQRFKA